MSKVLNSRSIPPKTHFASSCASMVLALTEMLRRLPNGISPSSIKSLPRVIASLSSMISSSKVQRHVLFSHSLRIGHFFRPKEALYSVLTKALHQALASMLPPSEDTETFSVAEPSPLSKRKVIPAAELERKAGAADDWSPWGDRAPLSARDTISLISICNVLLLDSTDATKKCAAAYLLQLSELKRCNLSERPCPVTSLEPAMQKDLDDFLVSFTDVCATVVETLPEQENWDAFDLLDSRILRQILKDLTTLTPTSTVISEAAKFAERVHLLTGVNIAVFSPKTSGGGLSQSVTSLEQADAITSVMPFRHPDLNKYLEAIHVAANGSTGPAAFAKVFREISHWHNAKKAIDPKTVPRPAGYFRRLRNQKLMADTIAYSASLTNAAGKTINPETIVTSLKVAATPVKNSKAGGAKGPTSQPLRHDFQPKSKKNAAKSGREKAEEQAYKIQKEKLDKKAREVMKFWDERCSEFQAERNTIRRLAKVNDYLANLTNDARSLIGAEVHLYVCYTLASMILDGRQKKGTNFELALFAKLWAAMLEAGKLEQSTESLRLLKKFSNFLKMPVTATVAGNYLLDGRRLPFSDTLTVDLQLPTKPLEFQLEHCGPFLERSFDPAPDNRVQNFIPDAWQRKVLDAIDAEKSLFVVAPTSAGKTFISFYAMKQVLQSSDDGIIVYVAPTKALVNQIAAEIQARFSKTYHHDGRSVWAIHTRDNRINNPTGCQVLVTVPHVLQIMLLAPSNAENTKSWSTRVKRIIFDEIHCIGQADDGVIWEQLLLLTPCPIIALSATVGNPLEFMQWLEASEKVKGREMEMIVHSSRYSDLRKFLYSSTKDVFVFKGLLPVEGLATPGLDEGQTDGKLFNFIHPIVSLTNR